MGSPIRSTRPTVQTPSISKSCPKIYVLGLLYQQRPLPITLPGLATRTGHLTLRLSTLGQGSYPVIKWPIPITQANDVCTTSPLGNVQGGAACINPNTAWRYMWQRICTVFFLCEIHFLLFSAACGDVLCQAAEHINQ